jgi:hypothetical protein
MSRHHRTRQRAPKQTVADKTRQAFYHLALDWIDLHTRLPSPAHTDQQARRATTREYGHPAEWASDKSRQIADIFWSWHDMLAEHRNEHRPPEHTSEQIRVMKAWQYLEPRFEQLVEMVDEDALREINDLHFGIRRSLGYLRPVVILPVPCPGIDCGLLTLTRQVSVGVDFIVCASCGYTVRDDEEGKNYAWLVRVCLDTLMASVT